MGTTALPFRKALSTNSMSTAFSDFNSTITEPSGDGIFDLLSASVGVGGGAVVPSYLQLIPFGTAADDKTFDMRLYGYSATNDATKIYIPQLLLDISVTLCARTATNIAANTFFADTITVNDGAADNGPWRSLVDCQENMVASVAVHTKGVRYIRFDWDLAGAAEAESMNCLWRPFS